MPQNPKPLTPHVSARHRFGAELRVTRIARGMTQAELARLVHVHPDLIAKVEKAVRRPSWELAVACDNALHAQGGLTGLWPAVAAERDPRHHVEAHAGPGSGYGLEPLSHVANRLWRHNNIATAPVLLHFGDALDDLVKRYETEGPAVLASDAVRLRQQLESILAGSLTIGQRESVLSLASRASGLLAYMAVNLGGFSHAHAYAAEAYSLARESGNTDTMAWVRGTQSLASYYQHDYMTAAAFAHDGLIHAADGPQAIRLLVNGLARALAYLPGRQHDAAQAVTRAYTLMERLQVPEGISPCISLGIYSRGRVIANAITVFQTLGRHGRVLSLVDEIADTIDDSDSAWSRSLVSLDQAAALIHRQRPDVEQAASIARNAVIASAGTPITSVIQRARVLKTATTAHLHLTEVREFHEQLRQMSSPA